MVLALVFLMGLANVWFTFARSLIPFEVRSVITRLEVREEKHPGVDDVHILRLAPGGREIVVDREVAELLQRGDAIHKDAWSSQMSIEGEQVERVDLETSSDFKRMLIAMPLIALIVLMSTRSPKETRSALDA